MTQTPQVKTTVTDLRSLPLDDAVLMGGCDKTTPGLIGAADLLSLSAMGRRPTRHNRSPCNAAACSTYR